MGLCSLAKTWHKYKVLFLSGSLIDWHEFVKPKDNFLGLNTAWNVLLLVRCRCVSTLKHLWVFSLAAGLQR